MGFWSCQDGLWIKSFIFSRHGCSSPFATHRQHNAKQLEPAYALDLDQACRLRLMCLHRPCITTVQHMIRIMRAWFLVLLWAHFAGPSRLGRQKPLINPEGALRHFSAVFREKKHVQAAAPTTEIQVAKPHSSTLSSGASLTTA